MQQIVLELIKQITLILVILISINKVQAQSTSTLTPINNTYIHTADSVTVNSSNIAIKHAEYVYVNNDIRMFSDEYKDLIVRQINDTIIKYGCKCFGLYRVEGVAKIEVAEDVLDYFKNHGDERLRLSTYFGEESFYGIKVKYDPNGGISNYQPVGCVVAYIGKVFN